MALQKLLGPYRGIINLFKKGEKPDLDLRKATEKMLGEGFASIAQYLPMGFYNGLSVDCKHCVAFLFSKEFCRLIDRHDALKTLTDETVKDSKQNALTWAAVTYMAHYHIARRPCVDEL